MYSANNQLQNYHIHTVHVYSVEIVIKRWELKYANWNVILFVESLQMHAAIMSEGRVAILHKQSSEMKQDTVYSSSSSSSSSSI